MYPKDSVTLDLTLNPGDEVHAKVTYLGNQKFLFSLTDTTNGQSVSITETSTIAERISAEWITEAPVYRHHILPLSDFGPVDFLNASVTVNGKTGPILSDQWAYRSIVMETADRVIKATPSKLVNGDSFSVIWEHP
jgi:ABC-type ATPase with predicted acetyltransferase domain